MQVPGEGLLAGLGDGSQTPLVPPAPPTPRVLTGFIVLTGGDSSRLQQPHLHMLVDAEPDFNLFFTGHL